MFKSLKRLHPFKYLIEEIEKKNEKSLYTKLIECLFTNNYSEAETLINQYNSELDNKHTAIIYAIL